MLGCKKNTFKESIDAYRKINLKIFMAPNKIQPKK